MNTKAKQNGFTIIEVVLVLAIAALIFLMIFIAWPALQRGQRDTARKNDANTIASSIGTYRSNNNGKNPSAAAEITTFRNQYINELSQYDKGLPAEVTIGVGTTAFPTAGQFKELKVNFGTKCDPATQKSVTAGASSRQASIVVLLESGDTTNGILFCQDA